VTDLKNLLRFLILAAVIAPCVVFGQDATVRPVVHQGDTFPAALGYAGVALATTVWGVMVAVINHLWKRMKDQDDRHSAALIAKDAELANVQEARRIEVERLLREQKEIFAEVMVTTSKIGSTFDENKLALEKLQILVTDLAEVVSSWEGD
jgi:hypothetical protein